MAHIDKHAPQHRTPNTNRFLLLDGHDTRFQEEFLEYINNIDTNVSVVLVYHKTKGYGKLVKQSKAMGKFL